MQIGLSRKGNGMNTDALLKLDINAINEDFEPITPLTLLPMNDWRKSYIEKQENAKLFGTLIFDKEITVMFGNSNVGKSLFAYGIAEQISGGYTFMPQLATERNVRVLYVDCELSEMQLKKRYGFYLWSDNFHRAELNYQWKKSPIEAITATMESHKFEYLIVDNLTYLQSNNEDGQSAIELMHKLVEIKKRFDCGMLVITHVPKLSAKEPLMQNSMSGSKNIANLADSIFAMGESYKRDFEFLRYIKQVKCRNAEIQDKVLLTQIMDTEPFLRHIFYGVGFEKDYLQADGRRSDIQDYEIKVFELSANGFSTREIAEKIGVSHTTVNRTLKKGEQLKL